MPDYIYLLKNRLSSHQRNALERIRESAREAGMTVFLVGGAVRDLTSGSPVFDLDVTVQGNALKLKKSLEKSGGTLWGEHEPSRTLFFRFPVGVSVEISSSRREEYPKPGKPIYHWDTILEDLRRRDFTANAMALSLNEHSYGLLMDPLNGVADIEARQLRLVSNYGFIEDPSRLLRATRLMTRLGWQLDERTQTRFQNAKEEKMIEALSPYLRGYELEEIGHEEDGLRVLKAMEAEGWMPYLFPSWTTAAADAAGLEEMRKLVTQLQMQGVSPDVSAVSTHYLTAKVSPKELAALKAMFVRPGFVEEWNNLDHAAKEFSKQLTGKESAAPSATWKLFTSADPQAVLWLGLTTKSPVVQAKYKNFFSVWPQARQKVPYALFQEMRITPEIPGYDRLLSELFFGIIDGKLESEEELRAFLEPYSPPAPPPPVTVRRTRGSKKAESKSKAPVETDLEEDAPELEDEDVTEDALEVEVVEDDEDEEEEPEVPPPPARKSPAAPLKGASRGEANAEIAPAGIPSVGGKTKTPPTLQVVGPAKAEKLHVMTKPAKTEPTAVGHASTHSHAPAATVKKAAQPLRVNDAKLTQLKATAKSVAHKSVATKTTAGKAVAAKPVKRAHAKPAPPARHALKAAHPAKKTADKAPSRPHKKSESMRKSAAKKSAPVRKHR